MSNPHGNQTAESYRSKPSEGWISAFKHRYRATECGIVRPDSNGNLRIAGYTSRGKQQRVSVDHLGERHTYNGATLAWLLHFNEWPELTVTTKNGKPRDLRRGNLKIKGDSND